MVVHGSGVDTSLIILKVLLKGRIKDIPLPYRCTVGQLNMAILGTLEGILDKHYRQATGPYQSTLGQLDMLKELRGRYKWVSIRHIIGNLGGGDTGYTLQTSNWTVPVHSLTIGH